MSRKRSQESAGCALGGVWVLLVVATSTLPIAQGQLAFIQQNSAVNPLQGQGAASELYGEQDVQVYIVLNRLLEVNEDSYSFKANFWWGMIWQDERTYGIIQNNTLSDPTYICQSWCSTEQGLDAVLADQSLGYGFNASSAGTQGLCCDNVYVPGSVAQNVIGYDVQSLPVQYQLTTLPNNYVSYRVQVQGDFYAHFNFNSYPFDRHQLTIEIQNQFIPRNLQDGTSNGADFLVLYAQNFGSSLNESGTGTPYSVSVYNSAQLSQGQSWQIDRLELNTMNYTFGTSGSSQNPTLQQAQLNDLNSDGVQFIIHISRTSKGFYALMIIVPISLIIMFSFVIFILPVTQIKGRMNIMATLFLTLIVLQFVLEGIMPTSYTLIPPYYLLLVSYIYIFGMVGLAVFTNSLATQWQRRSARIGRAEARQNFSKWIEELPPPPPDSKLVFGQLPTHHHGHHSNGHKHPHSNPIVGGKKALARIMLNHRIHKEKDDSAHEGNHPLDIVSNKAANGPLEQGDAAGDLPPMAPHNSMYTVNPIYIVGGNGDEDEDFESVFGDPDKEAQEHKGEEGANDHQAHLTKVKSRPWTMKQRSSFMTFLLRNDRFRWWSMWWYFIGRPESKEYCEFCAMKVEHWVLPMIFLSYAAVVAIIFGVAQSSSASNLDSPVG